MRVHAGLILFIGAMLVAAAITGVLYDSVGAVGSSGSTASSEVGLAEITSVSVYGVSEGVASYATIEVSGGSQPLNLSSLVVRLQTSGSSLAYELVD